MIRILMVCMGNICRSPMAAAAARSVFARAGMASAAEFESAGTSGSHVGEKPDPRAFQVAEQWGYDLRPFRSRKVVEADFSRFDLLLAMDRENLATLRRRCPAGAEGRLHLFLQLARMETEEVPDPYYGSIAGFERVADLCARGAEGLLRVVRSGEIPGTPDKP